MKDSVIILGAGAPDGLGGALARRFAADGLHVIVTGRTLAKLQAIVEQVAAAGGSIEARRVDVTASDDQDQLFAYAAERGPLEAVVFNAGINARIPFEKISAEQFEQYWRINCLGAFLAAQRAMPILRAQGSGSMLFTGASGSLRGKANFAPFASSKAALRNLAQSLAREYGPQGVHVAHIIVDGLIDGQRAKQFLAEHLDSLGEQGALSPDAIAQAFAFIHGQERSAWTHELDLRPFREAW